MKQKVFKTKPLLTMDKYVCVPREAETWQLLVLTKGQCPHQIVIKFQTFSTYIVTSSFFFFFYRFYHSTSKFLLNYYEKLYDDLDIWHGLFIKNMWRCWNIRDVSYTFWNLITIHVIGVFIKTCEDVEIWNLITIHVIV